jgi:hypothetical protein
MQSRKLLLIVAMGLLIVSCGSYSEVVLVLPESGKGWKQPILDSAWRYECGGEHVEVSPGRAHSRKLAQGVFWVPIPGTSEDTPKRDISEPLQIAIRFDSNDHNISCGRDYVSLRGVETETDIFTTGATKLWHDQDKGFRSCIFDFPPIEEIGKEFEMYFSPKILSCEITPLLFRRKDTTSYGGPPPS